MSKYFFSIQLILSLLTISAYCQNNEKSSSFIILAHGDTCYGKVIYEDPIFSRSHILFNDSLKYNLNQIKAFRVDGVFRVNIPVWNNEPADNDIAQRTGTGRIERYEKCYPIVSAPTRMSFKTPGGTMHQNTGGFISTEKVDYFSKNNGPIRPMKRNLLAEALSDNPQSMACLNTHRNIGYAKIGVLLAGIGMVGYGLSKLDKKEGLSSNAKNYLIGGGIVANLSWIFHFIQSDYIDKAINSYNQSQ